MPLPPSRSGSASQSWLRSPLQKMAAKARFDTNGTCKILGSNTLDCTSLNRPYPAKMPGGNIATNTRSAEIRELDRTLAALGHRRVTKGEALNVRMHEQVRRTLAEAGHSLGWSAVAATSDDPVAAAATDVKKMLKRGVKSLKRSVATELAEKEVETTELEAVVETVRNMAEDPKAEFPAEITYSHTAKSHDSGFVTKTETLMLTEPSEAASAAKKLEKSQARWEKYRAAMVIELEARDESLGLVTKDLAHLIDSWKKVLKEVLTTMS